MAGKPYVYMVMEESNRLFDPHKVIPKENTIQKDADQIAFLEQDKKFFLERKKLLTEIVKVTTDPNSPKSSASQIYEKIEVYKALCEANAQKYKVTSKEIAEEIAGLKIYFLNLSREQLRTAGIAQDHDHRDGSQRPGETQISTYQDTRIPEALKRYEAIVNHDRYINPKEVFWEKDTKHNIEGITTRSDPKSWILTLMATEPLSTDPAMPTTPREVLISYPHKNTTHFLTDPIIEAAKSDYPLAIKVDLAEKIGDKPEIVAFTRPIPAQLKRKFSSEDIKVAVIGLAIKDHYAEPDPYIKTVKIFEQLYASATVKPQSGIDDRGDFKGAAKKYLQIKIDARSPKGVPDSEYCAGLLLAAKKTYGETSLVYQEMAKQLFADPKEAEYWFHGVEAQALLNRYKAIKQGLERVTDPTKKEEIEAELAKTKLGKELAILNNIHSRGSLKDAKQDYAPGQPNKPHYDPNATAGEIENYEKIIESIEAKLDAALNITPPDEKVVVKTKKGKDEEDSLDSKNGKSHDGDKSSDDNSNDKDERLELVIKQEKPKLEDSKDSSNDSGNNIKPQEEEEDDIFADFDDPKEEIKESKEPKRPKNSIAHFDDKELEKLEEYYNGKGKPNLEDPKDSSEGNLQEFEEYFNENDYEQSSGGGKKESASNHSEEKQPEQKVESVEDKQADKRNSLFNLKQKNYSSKYPDSPATQQNRRNNQIARNMLGLEDEDHNKSPGFNNG